MSEIIVKTAKDSNSKRRIDEEKRIKMEEEARKFRDDGLTFHAIAARMAHDHFCSVSITHGNGQVIYCFTPM